ncbi:sporulation membrane protein YtaF [Hazenella sp. IB182357]|uniref:Sporulation membrane protein YtaF n=1 Tax=Polycladospora coralii TaxID=2771432 RepID=A0A926RXS1_9BACL|nr:sporulation membrane protein YtaF [Polycladospora coralii]MBD1372796.1 sporulation membrane protein YtaF [Polycladospora coralii]
MFHDLTLLWLAFAVSLDSFGAGTTYGLRKMRIPPTSIVIIGICSGIVIYLAMKIGDRLSIWFSPFVASTLGAMILISLGLWAVLQSLRSRTNDKPKHQQEKVKTWTFHIEKIGLVIQVLKSPLHADVDESGSITAGEAILLGVALSLDAFAAGIGASMMGIPALSTAILIAIMSSLFLSLGMIIGIKVPKHRFSRVISILPGMFLIVMGLSRML